MEKDSGKGDMMSVEAGLNRITDDHGSHHLRDLPAFSLSEYWMPFTNNREFKSAPKMLRSASGMYYYTSDGKKILDATAGLWCVNAGHGNPSITERLCAQAETLDYAPSFQLGHPSAFEFATQLAGIMPAGLDRIFFTNSGSESVDTALKMALHYQRALGKAGRFRLIGRERGYHGTNFGGTSVGGIGGNRRSFGTQVWGVDHLSHTRRPSDAFSRGEPASNEDLVQELDDLIALHGPDSIAAVIVEPVAGSTGVLVPPRGYLSRLREVTKAHGIVLIFDEVITGFGRLGTSTAAEFFGVTPDIITLAKGMTNGAVPMGAVAASREIHDAIINGAQAGIEFPHGYTYSGHPLACAAGMATLDFYKDVDLFARSASLAGYWEDAVHSLRGSRHITDIRNIGLVAGIELASKPAAPGQRALEIFNTCFENGLLIRVTGDIIALSPPLIIDKPQIDEIVDKLSQVIGRSE